MDHRMTPVLKWAGGKGQLLEALRARMPKTYRNYYEPFIGGGALFLNLAPGRAVINDINEQLVNLYRQLKAAPDAVLDAISTLDAAPCDKDFYLSTRQRYNEKIANRQLDPECAALMIWINKHCFNGLYRVNGRGLFNVPYNNRVGGASVSRDNLAAIGAYLRTADVTITCLDFEAACAGVQPGDFVYFDSPYVPVSDTADFTDYTKDGFSLADHQRLAALFRRLDAAGVQVMLSNHDVELVRELYAGYPIQSLEVKRLINRDAAKRTGREVLITNYP